MINAFRHQRFLHRRLDWATRGTSGDQRLSASKIFAQKRPGTSLQGYSVINAFRHQRFLHEAGLTTAYPAWLVINAFRHQRFLHWMVPTVGAWLSGAGDQRLSASKIFAQRLRSAGIKRVWCDQRLSASKIFAQRPKR